MLGIIVGLGLAAYLMRLNFKDEKELEAEEKSVSSAVFVVIISLLLGALVFVCVDGILMGPAKALMTEKTYSSELESTQEIIALGDASEVNGSLFLGCGSINEKEWYVYYTNTDYGFKKNKLSAEDYSHPVYIKYIEDGQIPHIDKYREVKSVTLKEKSVFLSLLAYAKVAKYNVGDEIERKTSFGYNDRNNERYEIFIPAGSIKNDYVIDME